jgi:uncharacterized glyoxalase superfamily protein PhnB
MTAKVYPALRFGDADAGRRWLEEALGFEEHRVYRGDDGAIVHAELRLGDDIVMFGPGEPSRGEASGGTVYIAVDDVDAAFERAKAAGATVVRGLRDTDYGSREFAISDPDGRAWSIGTYRP